MKYKDLHLNLLFSIDLYVFYHTMFENDEISFLYDETVFFESPFSIYRESKKDPIK